MSPVHRSTRQSAISRGMKDSSLKRCVVPRNPVLICSPSPSLSLRVIHLKTLFSESRLLPRTLQCLIGSPTRPGRRSPSSVSLTGWKEYRAKIASHDQSPMLRRYSIVGTSKGSTTRFCFRTMAYLMRRVISMPVPSRQQYGTWPESLSVFRSVRTSGHRMGRHQCRWLRAPRS
ncbi:hypothetical protein BMS3Bbin02_02210 [bacterium BMS3Bbin02]|nr:hypothetical protein BMS3Bbin02_02210 [bacterium BMS3Bbin02]